MEREKKPPRFINNRWFRLITPLILAFFGMLLAFTLPISQPTPNQISGAIKLLPGVGIVYAADGLVISKNASPVGSVDQGRFITYTLLVQNFSAGPITATIVQDALPPNTSCAIADGGQIFDGEGSILM